VGCGLLAFQPPL